MSRARYLLVRGLVRTWVRNVPVPIPYVLLHWYAIEVGNQFRARGLR